MIRNRLGQVAWENFMRVPGSEKRYGDGRFNLFITPDGSYLGKPFPVSYSDPYFTTLFEDNSVPDNWAIPGRHSVVAVYLGKGKTPTPQRGIAKPRMLFATPTAGGKFLVYATRSGKVVWFGDSDDPLEQAGIGVTALFVTNPASTEKLQKDFGRIFCDLEGLAIQPTQEL